MKTRNRIKYGFFWVLAGAAMITLVGFATMYLWNWLIPTLFNGPIINFIQAIGLLLLGKLLTHGFMGRGAHGWRGRHGHGCGVNCDHGGSWKGRWEEKMKNMTPEEKEKFKKYYYDRCGWGKRDEEKQSDTEKNTMAQ